MTVSRLYSTQNANGEPRVLVIVAEMPGHLCRWRIDRPDGVTVYRDSMLQGGGGYSSPVAAVKSARRVLEGLAQ